MCGLGSLSLSVIYIYIYICMYVCIYIYVYVCVFCLIVCRIYYIYLFVCLHSSVQLSCRASGLEVRVGEIFGFVGGGGVRFYGVYLVWDVPPTYTSSPD